MPKTGFLVSRLISFVRTIATIQVLNFRTSKMFVVITLNRSFHREICPISADGMANSVDPDQTAAAPLFAKAYHSQNPKLRMIRVVAKIVVAMVTSAPASI